jgi:hypothetical protein
MEHDPSAGGIGAKIAKRLKGARYAVGDVIFVIGRFLGRVFRGAARLLARIPVAIGRGASRFWRSLSVIARRRLVAALGVGAVLLILFSVVVPNLPCEFPGGDSCPPADDAAELVPAEALAYAHANLDPETEQYEAALELGADLPVLGGQIADRTLEFLGGGGDEPLELGGDVGAWFGGEVAIVALGVFGPVPERVDLLEVTDADAAAEFASERAVGQVSTTEYEGIDVNVDRRDVATAQVGDFLALGTEDAVRAVIATSTGADGAESLADDTAATELLGELPDHRFAEAWLSREGIEAVIETDRGLLGTLSPLAAPGASTGVAASLSAGEGELELAVRSALDPERDESSPGFFGAFPPFEPTLTERLRPQTLAYLGFGEPAETFAALLEQAGTQAPDIAKSLEDLVEGLQADANVDIEGELLGAFGGQAALALEPQAGEADDPATAPSAPYLMFLADGVDEEAARGGLAALAGELSGALGQQQVSGVETNSVRVSPTVELTYAVFDGLVAVATEAAGVAGVITDQGGLDGEPRYRDATADFPEEVALQAYFDLEGLVTTGEQAGLAEDPVYATFAGDFRRLDAFALAVSDADDVLATDARLLIGPPPSGDGSTAPLPELGD